MNIGDPPDVVVLLSVFDGDRFITEQLDSIAAQHGVRWLLLWRDDGSDPRRSCTPMLEAFRDRFPGQVFQARQPEGRLGVGNSYMALLAQAPDARFIAFADQDDVWLPDKLARAVSRLSTVPGSEPALYCGRQTLVDATLTLIAPSAVPRRPLGFGNALVQNVVTGCTIMLNRAARDAVLDIPPPDDTLHDWWCYLVVAGIGGRLMYDAEPFILYRQHGRNVVGAPAGIVARVIRAIRRGAGPFLEGLDKRLGRLDAHRGQLASASLPILDALRDARRASRWRRPWAVMGLGVYRQGTVEDLVLRLWLMRRPGR